MKFLKSVLFFAFGGLAYVGIELLWRGRSHHSMFLAGGTCFLLLGRLSRRQWRLPARALAGSGIITGVELLTGLAVNRSHTVWDYRAMPFNFLGQVCLAFSLLWIPVGLGAMQIYRLLDRIWQRQRILKTN